MSFSLACHEPEHFKAVIKLINGSMIMNIVIQHNLSFIQIHGTSDGTVNYYNGVGFPFWGSESAESVMNLWEDITWAQHKPCLNLTTTIVLLILLGNTWPLIILSFITIELMVADIYGLVHQHLWDKTLLIFCGIFFNSYCETSNSITTSYGVNPEKKTLLKKVDAFGREVNHATNQILFYIYDDGSVGTFYCCCSTLSYSCCYLLRSNTFFRIEDMPRL